MIEIARRGPPSGGSLGAFPTDRTRLASGRGAEYSPRDWGKKAGLHFAGHAVLDLVDELLRGVSKTAFSRSSIVSVGTASSTSGSGRAIDLLPLGRTSNVAGPRGGGSRPEAHGVGDFETVTRDVGLRGLTAARCAGGSRPSSGSDTIDLR